MSESELVWERDRYNDHLRSYHETLRELEDVNEEDDEAIKAILERAQHGPRAKMALYCPTLKDLRIIPVVGLN